MDPILTYVAIGLGLALVGLIGVYIAVLNAREKPLGDRRKFGPRHNVTNMKRRGY